MSPTFLNEAKFPHRDAETPRVFLQPLPNNQPRLHQKSHRPHNPSVTCGVAQTSPPGEKMSARPFPDVTEALTGHQVFPPCCRWVSWLKDLCDNSSVPFLICCGLAMAVSQRASAESQDKATVNRGGTVTLCEAAATSRACFGFGILPLQKSWQHWAFSLLCRQEGLRELFIVTLAEGTALATHSHSSPASPPPHCRLWQPGRKKTRGLLSPWQGAAGRFCPALRGRSSRRASGLVRHGRTGCA